MAAGLWYSSLGPNLLWSAVPPLKCWVRAIGVFTVWSDRIHTAELMLSKLPKLACLTLLTGMAVVAGCTAPLKTKLASPGRYTMVREQLMIHCDFPLAAQHRLIEELTARRFDISRRLGVPISNEPIHVYLFEDSKSFDSFMRLYHPDFPDRRAFFVETDTRLIVYAHWGDRVAEDLRHEVTHGYLHSMVANLPLWLDEGLAEYFEVPRGQHGVNRSRLGLLTARLKQGPWQPDLQRIEQLDDAFEMTQDDYAEVWAWVHFLLHPRADRGELLHGYLADLRREGTAAPASVRLAQVLREPGPSLIEHVRYLHASTGAASSSTSATP